LGTAGTVISDPIDLRDISRIGNFSLSYNIAGGGGATTAGTSTFEYLGCPVFDGTYLAAGTFGSQGAAPSSGIISFSPVTIPFMKIKMVTGTSNAALVTAELNVR
jgi:hypothetical protein